MVGLSHPPRPGTKRHSLRLPHCVLVLWYSGSVPIEATLVKRKYVCLKWLWNMFIISPIWKIVLTLQVLFPVTLCLVVVYVWLHSNVYVLFYAMVVIKGLSYALNNPCKEMLYLPTTKVKFLRFFPLFVEGSFEWQFEFE